VFVKKIFNKYDTYDKGFLDKDELKRLLKENSDQQFTEEEVDELIVRIDENQNELIEEKELLTMYK
jgi:Ca2+-binding EF-hand superfamily protein